MNIVKLVAIHVVSLLCRFGKCISTQGARYCETRAAAKVRRRRTSGELSSSVHARRPLPR
jgi:hypothetical protein